MATMFFKSGPPIVTPLPVIMCLKCCWLNVEHLDISESSSDWAEQRFQIEIWAKSEAGSAYSGGAYIKKACTIG